MAKLPFVSILLPCRNEARHIGSVLDNILAQDYPASHLEVLVADGRSDDATREIVAGYARRFPNIHLLDNPDRVVPHALNACIRRSRGEVLLRMDAHAVYPENYVRRLVDALETYGADNVGGVWINVPGAATSVAKAIALATAHPFGIGNAAYRLGGGEPRRVDTVPFGCYPRAVFDRIGLFDEELIRNQDDEFNGRLIRSGGKILLLPDLAIRYVSRDTLSRIRRMFWQYGYFKPLVNRKLGAPATIRQLFPPILVAGLVAGPLLAWCWHFLWWPVCAGLAAYLLLDFLFALKLSRKDRALFFPLLVVFPVIHLSYGAGYWLGIFRFLLLRTLIRKTVQDPGITR